MPRVAIDQPLGVELAVVEEPNRAGEHIAGRSAGGVVLNRRLGAGGRLLVPVHHSPLLELPPLGNRSHCSTRLDANPGGRTVASEDRNSDPPPLAPSL
jgi:hypothetical protein